MARFLLVRRLVCFTFIQFTKSAFTSNHQYKHSAKHGDETKPTEIMAFRN